MKFNSFFVSLLHAAKHSPLMGERMEKQMEKSTERPTAYSKAFERVGTHQPQCNSHYSIFYRRNWETKKLCVSNKICRRYFYLSLWAQQNPPLTFPRIPMTCRDRGIDRFDLKPVPLSTITPPWFVYTPLQIGLPRQGKWDVLVQKRGRLMGFLYAK